jgi:hypothetical protein
MMGDADRQITDSRKTGSRSPSNVSPPLCPDAQPEMEESVAFGIVGGSAEEPRLAYLDRPQPVTDELLEMASPAHRSVPVRCPVCGWRVPALRRHGLPIGEAGLEIAANRSGCAATMPAAPKMPVVAPRR